MCVCGCDYFIESVCSVVVWLCVCRRMILLWVVSVKWFVLCYVFVCVVCLCGLRLLCLSGDVYMWCCFFVCECGVCVFYVLCVFAMRAVFVCVVFWFVCGLVC